MKLKYPDGKVDWVMAITWINIGIYCILFWVFIAWIGVVLFHH